MPVVTLGLSHKTAPIEVRERVVFEPERLGGALRELTGQPGIEEAVLLSTCNRTELYTVLDGDCGPETLRRWLERAHGLETDWLAEHTYVHRGEAAVTHLMNVAAGLDSLVIGEPQILGQTKVAWQSAADAGVVGPTLDRLFTHAFSVAKQVRTETEIGAHPVSVAFAAVSLARQIFGDLERQTALLIGAGETIELTARHLREQGIGGLVIANRSPERAEQLAEELGGEGIGLSEIPHRLHSTDIVVASTAATLPILGKGSVESALKRRRHRPIFMVDIAVPRDIEAEVGELPDVYLYTVDDLREVIEDNLRSRQAAAEQAQTIVTVQTERFMEWLRGLDAVSAIRALRRRAHQDREAVLNRARRRLQRGDDADDVLEYLAHTLTNKLLHSPTIGLRQAARQGDGATLSAARRVLGLDDDEGDTK
ncbi:Glutamyl-tRNA reductase [wastewater metagenome]|uniref:glutamyl-tRNA reductase n=2 Tax=unclassified sequences TaxID=12908 RepID=A0A5B8RB52_9ZZZZ|nr:MULTISPECIES: glutamyl-tRNA reductase [Arhodomonas]QEA03907.1 glutamyl-tRNA reductase [uncultured organism]